MIGIGPDRSVIEKIRKARTYITFRPEAPEWFRRFMTDNYTQAMQQLNDIQNHFPLDPIAEIQGWPAADAVGVLTDDGAGHFSWSPGFPGFPRLDQVLDPGADKTFNMNGFSLAFLSDAFPGIRLTNSSTLPFNVISTGIGGGSIAGKFEADTKDGDIAVYGQALSVDAGGLFTIGVYGRTNAGHGVQGTASTGIGVFGESGSGSSGFFQSASAVNVAGTLVSKQQGASTADLIQTLNNAGVVTSRFNRLGDLSLVKQVPYVWPGSNAAGVFTNDGVGNLSWSASTAGAPGRAGIDGRDGDDGLDSFIPGPSGATGAAGVAGATGPAGQIIFVEPDDPELAVPIPGPPGATGATGGTGATGAAGAAGPAGVAGQIIFLEPDDPELPMMIPGNPGTTGATGTQGAAGVPILVVDGEDAEPPMLVAPSPAAATVQLGQQTLTSDTTTVTFSNIPPGYTNLVLCGLGRSDQSNAAVNVNAQFNSDSGSNYTNQQTNSRNVTVGAAATTATTSCPIGVTTGTANQADAAGWFRTEIFNYANPNFNKHYVMIGGCFDVATGASEMLGLQNVGRWKSLAALNRIDLSLTTGKFKTNYVFTLYATV